MPTGFYQMKMGKDYQLKGSEKKEKALKERQKKARARRPPQPIPKFDASKSKGFRTDTVPNPRGNQNTKNPSRSKRKQDLASDKRLPAGQYLITPAGSGERLAKPRADKGRKRGKNDGRSRRASVSSLPESLGYKSLKAREQLRGAQGGVKAFGHSLQSSGGAEPIGGWNGMNIGQLNPSKARTRSSARSSELQEDIKQKKQDLQYKVTKLDHPDNDPKKFNDAILNDLAIRRIMNRNNKTRNEAEDLWYNKTEQEKRHFRNQELQSAILEAENERATLEKELEKIAGLEVDLEEELLDLDAPILTEAGGSAPSSTLFSGTSASTRLSTEQTRKQAEFRTKLKLMREFGQIDEDTAEGKGKLFALIDEASAEVGYGPVSDVDTTAEQNSGPLKSVPIKKGTPLTGQTLRPPTDEEQIPEGPFRKMKVDDLRRAKQAKGKREAQIDVRRDFGVETNIDGFANALRDARTGVVDYFKDEWSKAQARNDLEKEREAQRRGESLNPATPAQLAENARRQEAEKREARRQNALSLRQKAKEYGQTQSDYNRREEAVENVSSDLVDSILNRMTFPAEVEAQENRREVGRERRRQRGAEIFKSADKVELRDLGEEEDKRQAREQTRKATNKIRSSFLENKLKSQDPRFMSDDDLEAKAKNVSERLRDEERLKETERKWEDVILRSDKRDADLIERPPKTSRAILKLPQPSNVVSFSTDTEEEEEEPEFSSSDTSSVRQAQEDFLDGIEEPREATAAELGREKAQKEIKQIKAKVVRDLINPLQKTNRYQNAEHFGASGMSPERIEALRRMKDKAEKDKENKRERLTENLRRQIGIKEKAEKEKKQTKKVAEQSTSTQTAEVQPLRQQPLPSGQQPIIAGRYQRGSTREFLSDKELTDLDNMKLRLAQLKGELNQYGFPRRLVDSRSKKDREAKDVEIAKKLSELRNNADYQVIQDMIAEAIRLSQNINKLTVKGSQLKKKKK